MCRVSNNLTGSTCSQLTAGSSFLIFYFLIMKNLGCWCPDLCLQKIMSILPFALALKRHLVLFFSSTRPVICIFSINPSVLISTFGLLARVLYISLLSHILPLPLILFPAFFAVFPINICFDLSDFYFILQSKKLCTNILKPPHHILCCHYLDQHCLL